MIHRDIKPDNILIERGSGRAILTDFGIARATAADSRLTATGMSLGTPAYMSPEQAVGESEIDGRSDLYSLGVVGFQMLVGQPPFRATSTLAMMRMHVSEPPPKVRDLRPDVPVPIAFSIDRCLQKRPGDRWSSAAELHDALSGMVAVPEPRPVAALAPAASKPPAVDPGAELAPNEWRAYSPGTNAPQPWMPNGMIPMDPVSLSPPPGLSGRQLRRWMRHQHQQHRHAQRLIVQEAVRALPYDDRPLWDRVTAFRRSVFQLAVFGFPTFPLAVMTDSGPLVALSLGWNGLLALRMARRAGSIWSDGIGPLEAFKKGLPRKLREMAQGSRGDASPPATRCAGCSIAAEFAPNDQSFRVAQPAPPDHAAALVPADVLAGTYGAGVRRAADDAAVIRDIVNRLTGVERDMLPDVGPTVSALLDRVASLSITLHRLDADVSGASLGSLDERIMPPSNGRRRRESRSAGSRYWSGSVCRFTTCSSGDVRSRINWRAPAWRSRTSSSTC